MPAAALVGGCAGVRPPPQPSSEPRSRAAAPPLVLELALAPAESVEEALRRARDNGFQRVLLPAQGTDRVGGPTLASVRTSNLRSALAMTGCAPLGVRDPLAGLPPNCLVEAEARGPLLALRDAMDLCAAVSGKIVLLSGGPQRAAPAGMTAADGRRQLAKRLLVAASWAAERRIELLVDALPPDQTNLINTPAQAIELIREVDHPALGVALGDRDVTGQADLQALLAPGGRVKLVRLQQPEPSTAGRVRAALDQAGYEGWLSVADGAHVVASAFALR